MNATAAWLFLTGLGASIFGTTVGLGGGFIVVPILLLFFNLDPAHASGTSLALVVANSAAASIAYARQRLTEFQIGIMIAGAGIVGSILGALAVKHVTGSFFDYAFAAFLLAVSIDLIANRRKRQAQREAREHKPAPRWFAPVLGFAVGFISSLFGIGGGVLMVPALLYFTALSPAGVSATSTFAIVLTAPVGLLTHWFVHDITWIDVVPLALGGVIGGVVGAQIAPRLKREGLVLLVGLATIIASGALVLRHFTRF